MQISRGPTRCVGGKKNLVRRDILVGLATPELTEKLEGLAIVVKETCKEVQTIQMEYEQQNVDLQTKVQLKTPLEVCAKREEKVKQAQDNIATMVTQCDKSLNEAMEIWASVQNDLFVQQLRDALNEKDQQFEEI